MENVYGIGVANRYALFLDEDSDPLDILKQSEAEQKIAKAKKIEDATKPVAKGPAVKKEAGNTRNEAGELIKILPHQFHSISWRYRRKASCSVELNDECGLVWI